MRRRFVLALVVVALWLPSIAVARARPAHTSERRTTGLALMGAGFGILGANYIVVASVAGVRARESSDPQVRRQLWPLLGPVVGPFISTGRADTPGARFGFVTVGILQTTLFALGTAGAIIVLQERHGGGKRRAARLRLSGPGLTLRF
ncbi:MAG: hypothetical protein AB1Z98_13120 [Nannocystaceae bacterium]